jgi:transposase
MVSPSPFSSSSNVFLPSPDGVLPSGEGQGVRPRPRGGQPGNQNARRNGTFSRLQPGPLGSTRTLLRSLNASLKTSAVPPKQVREAACAARLELNRPAVSSRLAALQTIEFLIKLNRLIARADASAFTALRLARGLESLARLPFIWFAGAYRDSGITRDADSFFPISQKSALNPESDYKTHRLSDDQTSLLPNYPTNLTDDQWSVLAPLIPPDPHLDWLTGEPPLIIAANRWGFTLYRYTGPAHDSLVLQKYHKILARCPGLSDPPLLSGERLGVLPPDMGVRSCPGHSRTSPRLLLDAILWKLTTGHAWSELPPGFPSMRLCRKYYRRLYLSGRWYTLMLALYNHFLQTSSVDFLTLLKSGAFVTTPSQKIALNPEIKPTWEHYTALLFMQLARSARSRLQRLYHQSHPLHRFSPDLKGTASLTTGLPPGVSLPVNSRKPYSRPSGSTSMQLFSILQSLQASLALKKGPELEKDLRTTTSELRRYLTIFFGPSP